MTIQEIRRRIEEARRKVEADPRPEMVLRSPYETFLFYASRGVDLSSERADREPGMTSLRRIGRWFHAVRSLGRKRVLNTAPPPKVVWCGPRRLKPGECLIIDDWGRHLLISADGTWHLLKPVAPESAA